MTTTKLWHEQALERRIGKGFYVASDISRGEISTCELEPSKLDIVGLLFGRLWCGSQLEFLPQLRAFYRNVNSRKIRFEVVFLSTDATIEDYERHTRSMPWLAVGHGDVRVGALMKEYNVHTSPALVILNRRGESLASDAVDEVMSVLGSTVDDGVAIIMDNFRDEPHIVPVGSRDQVNACVSLAKAWIRVAKESLM